MLSRKRASEPPPPFILPRKVLALSEWLTSSQATTRTPETPVIQPPLSTTLGRTPPNLASHCQTAERAQRMRKVTLLDKLSRRTRNAAFPENHSVTVQARELYVQAGEKFEDFCRGSARRAVAAMCVVKSPWRWKIAIYWQCEHCGHCNRGLPRSFPLVCKFCRRDRRAAGAPLGLPPLDRALSFYMDHLFREGEHGYV